MLCNIDMPMDIPYYWFQINYMLIFKSHACADHSSHEPSRSPSKGCLPDFSPWCFLGYPKTTTGSGRIQGLVNVPIEHHPTIGDIITNKYLKVMFKIPKTGRLPTPDLNLWAFITRYCYLYFVFCHWFLYWKKVAAKLRLDGLRRTIIICCSVHHLIWLFPLDGFSVPDDLPLGFTFTFTMPKLLIHLQINPWDAHDDCCCQLLSSVLIWCSVLILFLPITICCYDSSYYC